MNSVSEGFLCDLKGKKGALFSLSEVQDFLKEEEIHDDYTLTEHKIDSNGNTRKLSSFSSGQQKQLLLRHIRKELKNTQIDFLVLDNPYDCMDVQAQEDLAEEFLSLADEIQLIQIFKIRDEVLPCIQQIYLVNNTEVVFSGSSEAYDEYFYQQLKPYEFKGDLPNALEQIEVPNTLVKFTNVNIFYNETRQIVNNINWEIKKGEFWHLKGPNGSGKTSLLTMITGDNPKAFGEDIELFGRKKGSGETIWELKKKIGYFSPSLTHNFGKLFTVQHMVISGFYDSIGLYQKPTGHEIYEADKWLDLIGLKEKKQTYFVHLSPEMQRIVLIVRALVKYPPLLILDEPTNELDDYATSMLSAFIHKIHQETETTILYVSHRMLKGLHPDKVFELIPTKNGSLGKVVE
ncbi:ABC transporter ATP-binding protein [Wenyingzhuangia sp. IMCC45574]